jgi:glucose-6-phosphate isomerase
MTVSPSFAAISNAHHGIKREVHRWDGTPVTLATGEIFWGERGTMRQHLLSAHHQGTRLIPRYFMEFANTPNPHATGDRVHELFLELPCQTKAEPLARQPTRLRAEEQRGWLPARCFGGNRSRRRSFVTGSCACPSAELIASYEQYYLCGGVPLGCGLL